MLGKFHCRDCSCLGRSFPGSHASKAAEGQVKLVFEEALKWKSTFDPDMPCHVSIYMYMYVLNTMLNIGIQ